MSITRRKFLASTSALAAASALNPRLALSATLIGNPQQQRSIVGYSWPQTVRPGDRIDFMVSTLTNQPYRADLVRIICGDDLSSPEMFKEEELSAPFNGDYPGRFQPTYPGSYVEVKSSAALNKIASFTVQAMVYPTYLPEQKPDDLVGEQCLVSRWDQQKKKGWALLIDDHGQLAFSIGDGVSAQRVALGKPLSKNQWFLAVASYEAKTKTLRIMAEAIPDSPGDVIAWPRITASIQVPKNLSPVHSGPLRFAACTDGQGNGERLKPGHCFNGRLDRVRITAGALTDSQVLSLAGTQLPKNLRKKSIGFWDFGKDINAIDVRDLSPHKLDGITVNVPLRAVTGVDWDGTINDWQQNSDHYSAIHFHDDDLYDAEWQAAFSFQIPKDMSSKIYAVRLRQGDSEDYIPFFVAPKKNKPTAPVALLIPTANYTAYTNDTEFTTTKINRRHTNDLGPPQTVDEDFYPIVLQDAADAAFLETNLITLGKGLYHRHTDGTPCAIASAKHPNMTIKPKSINWTLVADTYITDWMEKLGIDYDIVTDDLLHAEGVNLLEDYGVVMTGNHPEYYSTAMLDAVAQYQDNGGRLMYLGGNGFFWVTGFHSQLPGVIEVRKNSYGVSWESHEIYHACDGVRGGLWKKNARPSNLYVGVHYDSLPTRGSAPYKRLGDSYNPRAAFIFAGVENETFGDYGIIGNGAAGQEVDNIDYENGTPSHALHLARADDFPYFKDIYADNYQHNVHIPSADMVFFEVPKGGAVFSVGSMAWVGSLSHSNYSNDISKITENVLRRFLDKSPFEKK